MKYLLAVDVGNSHTTLGLFEDSQLLDRWRIDAQASRTADEIWVLLRQLLESASVSSEDLKSISVSSVVPDLTKEFRLLAEQRLNRQPLIISVAAVPWMKLNYRPPTAVGADRLCASVAAFEKYGGPVIIIDLGTATVFDVVDKKGSYLGGLIAPGIQTAVDSLHERTALLPRVELSFPPGIIGTSTETAIQSGILFGGAAMIDGLVEQIRGVIGDRAQVVATGGFAGLMKIQSRSIAFVEPDLVLEGIRIITDRQ